MCSIRHTKMMNTCDADILDRSPAFSMIVGRMHDTLNQELPNPRPQTARNTELVPPSGNQLLGSDEVRIDRERKTALNVYQIY